MNFFVPGAKTQADAEQVLRVAKERAASAWARPMDDRRIFSIRYNHDGISYHAKVGEPHAANGEPVIAILKSKNEELYFVCTPTRGVFEGGPIAVGGRDTAGIEDFTE